MTKDDAPMMDSTCPLCGSAHTALSMQLKDHVSSHESFEIATCTDCSFVYTAAAPTQDQMGEYYKGDYYISHSDSTDGIIYKTYHLVRQFMLGRKSALIAKLHSGKSLLDIGTGTGYFADYMSRHGYQVQAIEESAEARKFANKKFGLQVQDTDFLNTIKPETVDVITMWHVLEHVHDFKAYIQQFHNILTTDGRLILALPNCASYDAEFYGRFWAGYDVPRHLWHFTPDTVKLLLEEHNFTIESTKFLPFDPYHNALHSENFKGGSWRFLRAPFVATWSLLVGMFNVNKASSPVYIARKNGSQKPA